MKVCTVSLEDAIQITRWKYSGKYSFYDYDDSPESIKELMDGTYFSLKREHNELIGFCCFGSNAQVPGGRQFNLYHEDQMLDLGLGMRPDLTGRGMGMLFLTTCMNYASETFPSHRLRLSVATFNKRAIALYTNAGFKPLTSFDNKGTEFLIMTR
ncbi:N-acetyltransferase [Paenibacillus baekrokdamisoli]|uniref:N-acetyltransferase n=1 Tax=Paenibacillus baekrokdamisoli TaxID=1712516 RepID=A0A3G9J3C3_9BACL|nr:GNAT family protein [Paenibacillus baekrokdamisoli]MBB3072008.1 RimJ/RimL family protein N-acetyltransferase [Paenibacillus baekrokdamisoli]BBH20311.1 N-acetyltransferase [Paenibacillus baekrokdamisoli]